MIKQTAYLFLISGTLAMASCGGSGKDGDKKNDSTTQSTSAAPVPKMTINESDWVAKDLSTVSNLTPVTVKLPKDAKMEKNGNGGVDIHVSDWYDITVSNNASSSVADAMKDDKTITVDHQGHQDGKVVIDEPNGFVYTYTLKTEENGTKYQPESHFVYYVEKDGAIYSFESVRPQSNFFVPGSAYTLDLAKQVYNIIKSSAKAN